MHIHVHVHVIAHSYLDIKLAVGNTGIPFFFLFT